jgi:hypothetical protein
VKERQAAREGTWRDATSGWALTGATTAGSGFFYVRMQPFASDPNAFCAVAAMVRQNAPESDFSKHYPRS